MDGLEVDYPHLGKFTRATHVFATCIVDNAASLVHYGERFRAGEPSFFCPAQSTVNAVIQLELGRSMARSDRCSSDDIRGRPMTPRPFRRRRQRDRL
ncbi:MAG: hypothetical protein ACREE5_07690 [Acetobacteraceae bacterium]